MVTLRLFLANIPSNRCENALRCADVKVAMIKFRVKKYLALQEKNLLGSAFHASFVQDKDAPLLVLKCLKVCLCQAGYWKN